MKLKNITSTSKIAPLRCAGRSLRRAFYVGVM